MPELQPKAPPPEPRPQVSNVPRPGLQPPSTSSDRPGRRPHSAEPRPSPKPGPGPGRDDRPSPRPGRDDRPKPGPGRDDRPSPGPGRDDRPDRPAVLTKKQQKEQQKEEERWIKEQERIRKEREKESRHQRVPSSPFASTPALQSTAQSGGPAFPGGFQAPERRPSPPSVSTGGRPPQQPPAGPQDGPLSPRTSFWGFYSPGTVANDPSPSHRPPQQPPAHPPKPPAYGGKPSPAHAQSPAQNMPGSYFPPNPPPPPPALPGQQPQPQQGGSHGGLSSFLGNVLPHGPNGPAMPSSASQAVKMAGNLGMQLFDKYTKKP